MHCQCLAMISSSSKAQDAPAEPPGTHEKALRINLDKLAYGAFAEIGAGQEVARRFFHVGGASGTVAKTMSASLASRRTISLPSSAFRLTVTDFLLRPSCSHCRDR